MKDNIGDKEACDNEKAEDDKKNAKLDKSQEEVFFRRLFINNVTCGQVLAKGLIEDVDVLVNGYL